MKLISISADYNRWARQKYKEQVRSRSDEQRDNVNRSLADTEGPPMKSKDLPHGHSADSEGNIYHDVDHEVK